MLKKIILILFFLNTIGNSTSETSKPKNLCVGFLPPNDLNIPVFSSAKKMKATGLSYKDFNEVLNRIEKIYAEEIKQEGQTLVINRHWEDGTVNASASVGNSGELNVDMYGGMARLPTMTKDGFAMVVCHELGHHLGGGPNYWDYSSMTVEGEADYYSTLKCAKRYFAEDNLTENNWLNKKVNPLVLKRCTEVYTNTDEQNYCIRSSYAGLNLTRVIKQLKFNKKEYVPRFDLPDPKLVASTYPDHSVPQCRLDTFLAGATCPVAVSEKRTAWDYHTGSCYDTTLTPYGLRPRCWFNPEVNYQPPPHKGR